jgi:phosphoglycolate phosphatase
MRWARSAASKIANAAPSPERTAPAMLLHAVLIDLDGTLLDTAPDLAAAANRVRADFGLAPLAVDRIAAFVGKGAEVLVHRALTDRMDGTVDDATFAQGRAAFYRHYHDTNGKTTIIFDGVPEALALLRARRIKIACVTNKPREFTQPLLEQLKLAPLFDTIVAGDDVKQKKPHPDLLFTGCRNMGVEPARARMIGDSLNDALAADAAGMRAILVETGYNEGESVASLAGMPCVDAIVPGLIDAAKLLVESLHNDSLH